MERAALRLLNTLPTSARACQYGESELLVLLSGISQTRHGWSGCAYGSPTSSMKPCSWKAGFWAPLQRSRPPHSVMCH